MSRSTAPLFAAWVIVPFGLALVFGGGVATPPLPADTVPPPVAETLSAEPKVSASPSPAPNASLPPPVQPLRAWSVAASDGAVFVWDATHSIYQLAPGDLAPLTRSSPLFAAADDAPAYLLADEAHLFVGSAAFTQTLVLNRSDFSPVAALNRAGPMALDPGKKLFMASEFALWAYDLADLGQPPVGVTLLPTPGLPNSLALDLAADPTARQLYVRFYDAFGSPPHNREVYRTYNLDTLAKVGESKSQLGTLSRPAVAGRAGLIVTTFSPKSGFFSGSKLTIFDRQGQELKSHTPLDGLPATDADGDWIYLLRQRGLWVLRESDLSLQSIQPFTATPPADLLLSPDARTLYLFGNGWLTALSTAEVQSLGFPPVSPFPTAWTYAEQKTYTYEPLPAVRLYPSPEMDEDGVAFIQVGLYHDKWGANETHETYRTTDGGRSWRLLLELTYPYSQSVQYLSLSPDFASDHTLVEQSLEAWLELYDHTRASQLLRSTDGGNTWAEWTSRIAFTSERNGNREIYTMNQEGSDLWRLTDNPAADENPAWSPAWTRVAFQSNRNGNWDIFTVKSTCDPRQPETSDICDLRQLTADKADDMLPAWSPDGRSIAFVSSRDGNPEIYVMDSDGQNQRRLTFNPTGDWRPAWLPDSRCLVFTSDRGGNNDIYMLTVPPPVTAPLTSESDLTPVVTGPADDRDPAVSADGNLLFLSDRDGTMRAYTLDLRYYKDSLPLYPFADTHQPEAHPCWVGEYAILVAAERNGVSNIYRVSHISEYQPLASSPHFDGHPACGPVWWVPEAAASRDRLQEHK
jgi:WD40 repeat protein